MFVIGQKSSHEHFLVEIDHKFSREHSLWTFLVVNDYGFHWIKLWHSNKNLRYVPITDYLFPFPLSISDNINIFKSFLYYLNCQNKQGIRIKFKILHLMKILSITCDIQNNVKERKIPFTRKTQLKLMDHEISFAWLENTETIAHVHKSEKTNHIKT